MRILITRLGAYGDIIHAMPVAMALRRHLPDARIGWIVERKAAPLVKLCSAVDDVLMVDTGFYRKQPHRAWFGTAQAPGIRDAIRDLREFRAEVVLDVQGSLKSGVVSALTGAPRRIGFGERALREKLNAPFNNEKVELDFDETHVIRQNLSLLTPLRIEIAEAEVEFGLVLPADAREAAARWLAALPADNRPLLMLHPGANWESKRMPVAHWVELGKRLITRGEYRLLLAWAPGEEAVRDELSARLGEGLLVAPPTSFTGLAGLIERCRGFVGPDTGPMHLAAAMGLPCATFFGPTDPARNGPWGANHATLYVPGGLRRRHPRQWPDPAAYWAKVTPERLETLVAEIGIRR